MALFGNTAPAAAPQQFQQPAPQAAPQPQQYQQPYQPQTTPPPQPAQYPQAVGGQPVHQPTQAATAPVAHTGYPQQPQQFQQPAPAPAANPYQMPNPPSNVPVNNRPIQQPHQAPAAAPGVQLAQPNIFGGMRDVRVGADANYMGAGIYWVRVDKVKQGLTRNNISNVIAEVTVIRCFGQWNTERTHMAGEQVAHYFDGKGNYFKQDLKKFAAGAFTDRFNIVDPNSVDENDIAMICGKKIVDVNGVAALVDDIVVGPDGQQTLNQPLRGMILEYNNTMQKGKDKLGPNGQMVEGKWWNRTKVVRQVLPDEALAVLTPEEVQRFFPNNFLQNHLQILTQAGKIPVPFQR